MTGPLLNGRHEKFAQALADGLSAAKAYVAAGYRPNRGQASRLQRDCSITQRVHSILTARAAAMEEVANKAIETASLDKAWVLTRLMEIVERCMEAVPVRDGRGRIVDGVWTFDAKGANRALELLGKHLGLFVRDEDAPRDLSALLTALAGTGRGTGRERREYDA